MSGYAPFTLCVLDEDGQELFTQTVPFEAELDVKGIMERAFILAQTVAVATGVRSDHFAQCSVTGLVRT